MFLDPVSPVEVEYHIKNLKNYKNNLNSISICILKENSSTISCIFADWINFCFLYGCFPKMIKKAIVVPIHKGGDPEIISNYRPISKLPYLSKIIEKCLKSRLVNYFYRHNLWNNIQFGFQKGLSTQDAVIHLTEKIYENLNDKLSTVAVYIDFSKCFDTLNRNILLRKMEAYGIRGTVLALFSSYLDQRQQAVLINNYLSDYQYISTGVPQGSVLAAILYLIYVNDIPNISNLFSPCLYADDTTLIFSDSDSVKLLNDCNEGINRFFNWCCTNRLSINISKTKIMLFSNILQPSSIDYVYMNGEKIELVTSTRFLGVIMDDGVKFDVHIDQITQKISKNCGILYKLRQYLHPKTMVSVYRSLIECYLNYCVLVFGNAYPVHINRLEIAQRKCIRIISHQLPSSHTNNLFYNLKVLKFTDIYKYNLGVYMYKNINSFLPNLRINHNATRSGNYYQPIFQRLTITKNQSLKYQAPINWEKIPMNIRDHRSINSFKKHFKQHLISAYEPQI